MGEVNVSLTLVCKEQKNLLFSTVVTDEERPLCHRNEEPIFFSMWIKLRKVNKKILKY